VVAYISFRELQVTLSHIGIIGVALLFGSCAEIEPSRDTDLSIDTYWPSQDALNKAETSAKEYWVNHRAQTGRDTRYLAVQSGTIFSDEIPDIYHKLLYSPGVNSGDLEYYGNNNGLNIYSVNIFDTRTEKLDPQGYAVVDLPRVGHVARFGTYVATFIGTGG
jgi:hypothetical protein